MTRQTTPFPLEFPPGILRDGALLDREGWVDGQWVRFWRNKPRKMQGYRLLGAPLTNVARTMHQHWEDNQAYVHTFHGTGLDRTIVSNSPTAGGVTDRTPAGFTGGANYAWQVTAAFDEGTTVNQIIAHPAENVNDIASTTQSPIYAGDVTDIAPLTALDSGLTTVDGGVVSLQPYLVAYGSAGEVKWTNENDFNDWTGGLAGNDRITGAKIVKGLPARNSTALLWSLDSLILMSFIGGAAVFSFTTLSSQVSVLSSNAVVEFEGRYYWPGQGQFFLYDGRISNLRNTTNQVDFFDNLNYAQRQKVWALVNPRWGEIWWFYPRGAATECTNAIIYNVYESALYEQPVWYDVELARSCGFSSQVLRYPLMTAPTGTENFFAHEYLQDEYDENDVFVSAIDSYVETSSISLPDQAQEEAWIKSYRLEPDWNQVGDMTVTVRGRKYSRSADVDHVETVTDTQEKVDWKEQRRHMRLRFRSNTQGGFYEFGKPLLSAKKGDQRQ